MRSAMRHAMFRTLRTRPIPQLDSLKFLFCRCEAPSGPRPDVSTPASIIAESWTLDARCGFNSPTLSFGRVATHRRQVLASDRIVFKIAANRKRSTPWKRPRCRSFHGFRLSVEPTDISPSTGSNTGASWFGVRSRRPTCGDIELSAAVNPLCAAFH